MNTVPAPPDLARLIEAHRSAANAADRVSTHYDLLRWTGWRKRVIYTHGTTRVALIWGSVKIDENGGNHKGTRSE